MKVLAYFPYFEKKIIVCLCDLHADCVSVYPESTFEYVNQSS
jgi:hypothetical protein